jgi:hypothetical protein
MSLEREEAENGSSLWAFVRTRPMLVGMLMVGGVGGAALATLLPIAPDDMSMARRVLGGGLAGVLFAMCALGFRLFDE